MQQSLLHSQEHDAKKKCACCTSTRLNGCAVFSVIVGLVLLLIAVYVPSVIRQKLDDGIADFVSIGPQAMADNTETFATWADSGNSEAIPVHQKIYFMNLTNPNELLAGAKPIVTEHGPYVYREFKRKYDITYLTDPDNRQLVQFREWTWWEFDASMSGPGLNPFQDKYTTINLPFQAVTSVMKNTVDNNTLPYLGNFGKVILDGACPEYSTDYARLFENKATVDQWLFGFNATVNCAAGQIPTPEGLSPAGYFPGILGANRGPNTNVSMEEFRAATPFDQMYTGIDDQSFARQYYSWKGETSLTVLLGATCSTGCLGRFPFPVWASEIANRVTGSVGLKFQSALKKGASVVAWVDQLMRHAPIINANNEEVVDKGITMLRYSLDPRLMLNSSQVPENAAYYADRWNGLLDISKSKQTLPLFMSKPHFLDADAVLMEDVIGMHPDRAAHDTSIDVEPLTGVTMRAAKRLQVNYKVEPWVVPSPMHTISPFTWYVNTTGTLGQRLTPILWVEESAEITDSKASEFRGKVYGAQAAEKYIGLLGGIFGALIIALAVILFIIAQKRAVRESEENAQVGYDGRRLSHVG